MIQSKYLSDISFSISDNLNDCYDELTKRNFLFIEGDIRQSMGKKFCALGIKKENTANPITNIIGIVSENREPYSIIEDGHLYKMIIDQNGNRDINKDSGGYYLYLILYY